MTTPKTLTAPGRSPAAEATAVDLVAGPTRQGRWIDSWDPEDPVFWRTTGRRIARRNLYPSIVAEFLGFSVWASWSIVVPQLAAAGFHLSVDQQFWLIAVPSLVGAILRIPYTFAVPLFGGRNWTVVSALLLLLPAGALTFVVQRPSTSFGTLLLVAALAGLGGGNFASSMSNISFFYPEAEKGRALGLNAAGGNLGTAAVQLAVPLVVVTGTGVRLERAGQVFVPLVLLAALLAWRLMDNLTTAKAAPRTVGAAVRNRHTWIISALYIGTFGSFIGYAGVFPTLLHASFPQVTGNIAFLGALVGSVARPWGGVLADRWGGARTTIASFTVMAAATTTVVLALRTGDFGLFLGSFLVLFVASGAGNGATYRMIPAVFRAGATSPDEAAAARRAAAGCIGIAGAVGALGGFLVPRGFALSHTLAGSLEPALWTFVAVYVVLGLTTWSVYRRRGAALSAAVI